jgi:hypothetical protein
VKKKRIGVLLSLAAAVGFAASQWSPYGWSGPYPNGGVGTIYPENLCASFTPYACIVAGVKTFNTALTKWPVNVQNSAGLNVDYTTNNRDTPGWIVVIGVTGLSWTISPAIGSHNGIFCDSMFPSPAGGSASVAYGSARYFYQAVFEGTYLGGPCIVP